MFPRLKAMLIKEFIQTFRDPRMRMVLFLFPIIQTIIFGYAVNMDVRAVPTAVLDRDNTNQSRQMLDALFASGHFKEIARPADEREAQKLLDSGKVRLALTIQPGFSGELEQGEGTVVQALLDGSDSNTASIIIGYLGLFAEDYNRKLLFKYRDSLGITPAEPATLEARAWFNADLASPPFYVPAVIASIVYIITILLSAMAIVREKEIGTIEQVIVTPIRKAEFILGKTLPFVLIGYANVAIVSLVGLLLFQVPIRGSIWLLLLATGLFLMSTLGTGLFVSTISSTQQQAKMSAFFIIFPAMLLSGFAFPIKNMPEVIQWLTLLNPMRYYLLIIRELYLKGTGMATLWPQMLALFLLGASVLMVAILRFRKNIG